MVNSLLELKKTLKSLSNKITYDFIDKSKIMGANIVNNKKFFL